MSFLVCKCCGYQQEDEQTIKAMRKKFAKTMRKGACIHDLPYYCGACLDTVSDEEYYQMMNEMEGDCDELS